MDRLLDVLEGLERKLDSLSVEHAVIGGLAVAAWGKARLTQDVDVKVALHRQEIGPVLPLLAPELTPLDAERLRAVPITGVLFLVDDQGTRVDLLLLDTAFDAEVLRRASQVELVPGRSFRMCTPEDLIIYKLLSSRPHDHADAQGVVRRQGASLDEGYILKWLREFEAALDDSTLVDSFRAMRPKG